ncbi:MAG TPA: excinuclease ABC subunit UvrA, partial [Nitrospirales bacterium]|nr:excinuclease ABC subunit UvrA [Nitrospirales bacterium]
MASGISGRSGDLLIEGARQHNLKNVSLTIPHNAVTVITGVSGSGKSSLAFDTLYAEGQWRYVESLSTYARMFIERLDRPEVDRLVNIRPAIAIEQKNPVRTARSTVGTATEIADLLRLLFAKIGHPICPDCGEAAKAYQPSDVIDELLVRHPDGRALILFPLPDGTLESAVPALLTRGFIRIKHGDDVIELQHGAKPPRVTKDVWVVVDRVALRAADRGRLCEAVETAFREGHGVCRVDVIGQDPALFSTAFRCQRCGRTFPPLRPVLFSFNHPLGACPTCKGFGNTLEYTEDLVVPDPARSLADGAIEPWTKPGTDWWQKQMLLAMKRKGVSLMTPYAKLSAEDRERLWSG